MNPDEEQTVLLTIIPDGITLGPGPLPVSVIVSPRLRGDDKLGAYPDWLKWTRTLKERGLTLVIRCGTQQRRFAIDQDVLRPDLWEELFHEDTLVRSYAYSDYAERGIISYSVRESLSAIKTVYQESAVELALPEDSCKPAKDHPDERRKVAALLQSLPDQADGEAFLAGHSRLLAGSRLKTRDIPPEEDESCGLNRRKLGKMLAGLDVHWNGEAASRWRGVIRERNSAGRQGIRRRSAESLDSEGLIVAPRVTGDFQNAALPFAVFHHMPTPPKSTPGPTPGSDPVDNPVTIDTDDVLDFHQALSSLNSYPELLRALGLVFDLELPTEFVETTDPGKYGTLAVARTSFDWQTPTTTPELETAFVNLALDQNRLFLTAPLILEEVNAPFIAAGLIALDPTSFGLAQVDVDGAMHKAIMTADTMNNPDSGRNVYPDAAPEPAPHPEVFDGDATLPSLRSGGYSLYADQRGMQLLDRLLQSRSFNAAMEAGGAQSRPFFAEDLLRGYRLDVWDSHTGDWHSLHRRTGTYQIGNKAFAPGEEEGFIQTAAMQPAPGAAEGPDGQDLYLHEAIARWAGWSLSVPMPGKHLSRYGDPDKAVPPDNDPTGDYLEDQPETPFKMTVAYEIAQGSLPRLAFGRRYRLRARAVDLAGNSLKHDAPLADLLALPMALPRSLSGLPYLRYEPVIAPLVVIRDARAVTEPGSAVDRLVIRTYNDDSAQPAGDADTTAADTSAADRHLLPPRTSVEMGERLGMFDDAAGKLKPDAATWQLIAERDAGDLNSQPIAIAGKPPVNVPVEPAQAMTALPYLPDPLAAGAALRDLPGTPGGTLARTGFGAAGAAAIDYPALNDPNPRPGSATLISFDDGSGDWQNLAGIRLSLLEPAAGQTDPRPQWDPVTRVLSVFLPKGQTAVVPLSTYLTPENLKLMGQWEWLRQYIELVTVFNPQLQYLQPGEAVDRVNHVLQRAVEGGHWLLNPPLLLTLIHAVQQPLGVPRFAALNVDHFDNLTLPNALHTAPVRGPQDPVELAPITAWRRLGGTDAFVMGALHVHGASTEQVDLLAEWTEPLDDPEQDACQMVNRTAHAETIPLRALDEDYLYAAEEEPRRVGYYDPENDQILFLRLADRGGPVDQKFGHFFFDAAPRHQLNDTKRRKVAYTAVASSRFREYFPTDAEQEAAGLEPLKFTRRSEAVVVDVPASARPLAPAVAYVLPTFGWQRQTETNVKRSVRFGGGLRVYLERPWFSSGEGELLGVTLWSSANGALTAGSRDKFKPYFTQWGMDPIWKSAALVSVPGIKHFPDMVASDKGVSLEERTAQLAGGQPGRVDVVGFPVAFDPVRKLWFADLTIHTDNETYMPFVRLALARYQPHALVDAQISRVVLADFAQLTPDRSVLITVDPNAPRQLRVVVSGEAPIGPQAVVMGEPQPARIAPRPTQIQVRLQMSDSPIDSDLTWRDVDDAQVVQVTPLFDDAYPGQPHLEMWAGTVTLAPSLSPARYRLLIAEHEYVSADYTLVDGRRREQPGRLIFAETVELDEVLLGQS